MTFSLKTLSIDHFEDFPSLLHAFSPRNIVNEKGDVEDLLLGRREDHRSSPRHRQLFLDHLQIPSKEIYFVKQVHGDRVYVLDDPGQDPAKVEREEADALVTSLKGTPIAVLTADCVPVILYDPVRQVVGVVHAGRKGTQMRIVSKTLSVFLDVYGSYARDVVMALGPAIGGCCYEVDEACIEPFRHQYPEWETFVTPHSGGSFLLDLNQAIQTDAVRAGILLENIHRSEECTSCRNDRWYSYRKEGTSGRMASLAMLREPEQE